MPQSETPPRRGVSLLARATSVRAGARFARGYFRSNSTRSTVPVNGNGGL